tara:strand:+ start:105 stop:3401 length:3297 start_codon:yes stop_codon:yes gene_type:complete
MGVKVKTPTPFIGAGQIGTITPNLSGMGSAIAGVADDLLKTRFEDRKQTALEQGTIDSHDLITYGQNGQLEPVKTLPEDNTWYSQAVRAGARTNYYNALSTDLKTFKAKTLAEFPNDPEAVKDQMEIYREGITLDLDQSLTGGTELMLKTVSEESVLLAQGNLFNKQKTDMVIAGGEALKEIETETYAQALNSNGGIFNGKLNFIAEQRYEDALMLLASGGAKGYSIESIPKKLEIFKKNVEVYKSIYQSKQFLKVLENPTGYTETQLNDATLSLMDLRSNLFKGFEGNLDQQKLFKSTWNEKVSIVKEELALKQKISNDRIEEEQKVNNFTFKMDIQNNNLDAVSWLNNPEEINQKVTNKEITMNDAISLHSSYHTIIETDEKEVIKIKNLFLQNAYKSGDISESQLLSHDSIKSDSNEIATYIKTKDAIIKTTNDNLTKQKSNNQDINILNYIENLPQITSDPNHPLFVGNPNPIKYEELEAIMIKNGHIDKELFNNGTYNKADKLKSILTARKAYIKDQNLKNAVIKAQNNSITNGTPMSVSDHNDMLKNKGADFDITKDDPVEYYETWNKPYLTLNGPLQDIINAPENLTQERVDKMLPLLEKIKNNEVYLFNTNDHAKVFWKTYMDGLKTSGISPDAAFDQAQKAHINSQKPDKRDDDTNFFNRHFRSMKSQEYNANVGGPIVKNLNLGLRSWQNTIGPMVAVATLGAIGDNKAIQNEGMNIPSPDNPEEMMDINNIDHQIEFVKINFANIASDSEGVIDFIQSAFKMDNWNDQQWRALVQQWGSKGNLSQMTLPTSVAAEALDRYKILFKHNSGPYANHPENRNKALFKLSMEILKEKNYSPELSGKDGMLAEGPAAKDYTLKWTRNSVTSAMDSSGWKAAGIRVNPNLMGNEISHMFNNMKWNKDPNNPNKYLFKPSDFGEKSFHDVSWMIKPNGFNENGTPIAEIYWFDKENAVPRVLQIKVLNEKGEETRELMNVSYPYEYKNSFYNAIYKDQSGKIEEYLKNNKWIQNKIGGSTAKLLAQAYLNGLNLFGDSDMAGYSPNFMNVIMQSYEYEMNINGGAEAGENMGKEKDIQRNHKLDALKINNMPMS